MLMFTCEQVNAFPGLAIEPVRPTTRPRPASLAPPIQQTLPLRCFFCSLLQLFLPLVGIVVYFYPLFEPLCLDQSCRSGYRLVSLWSNRFSFKHLSIRKRAPASEFRQSSRKKARLSLFFVSDCVPGEARSPSPVHPFRALSQCRSSSPQVQVIEKPAFPAS